MIDLNAFDELIEYLKNEIRVQEYNKTHSTDETFGEGPIYITPKEAKMLIDFYNVIRGKQ